MKTPLVNEVCDSTVCLCMTPIMKAEVRQDSLADTRKRDLHFSSIIQLNMSADLFVSKLPPIKMSYQLFSLSVLQA